MQKENKQNLVNVLSDRFHIQLLLKFTWVHIPIDKLLPFQIVQGINQSVLESFLCVGIKQNYKLLVKVLVNSFMIGQ